MKRLLVLAIVIGLACAANLWAQEKAAPAAGGATAPKVSRGVVAGKSAAQWYIESIDKIVNLTDAQKKAVTESFEARDKAMREFQAKNAEKLKAAGAAMMEAYKSKDKEAIAKSQKAYQDLYAPMHEAMKKSLGELDNLLTPEQKEKVQESRAAVWIKASTDPAQLTDEQVKKLKAAYGELTKPGHQAEWQKLPEAIDSVLTAEQKAVIARHRAMGYVKMMFARAKLTDEQMKRVEAMVDELAKDQNVKPAMIWQSYNKLAEKIRALLTAEQKKEMEAPFKAPLGPSTGGGQRTSPSASPGGMGPGLVYRLNEVVGGAKSAAQWYIDSIDKIVNLTDAQKKAITESIEARDKAMREFQAKNAEKLKAAGTAMMEAYKSKNKEAMAKSQKATQELYAPMHEAMKKSQGELDNILTPPQREKLKESRMMGWIKALTDPVQLTDEQTKKLKAAYGELTKAGHEVMERKLPELVQSVLTAEQKVTIAKHRAMMYVKAMFARAKLTDEQMKRVEAMVDELAKDQKADLATVWQSYNKLAEKIRELLTAEQKKAMEVPNRAGAAGASATPLPGGGFQVVIGERGETREGLQRRLQELSGRARRIEYEAHELREALERLGQQVKTPSQARNACPDPAIEQLRCQVQALRCEVEKLKAMVEKAGDKK
jgi:Spy/CpxP family protein refolding chaperone